jgi:hypothetical protein
MPKIPDAALKAGFNAFAEAEENAYTTHAEDLRAAFLAMIEAWPGARERPHWDLMTNTRHVEIILPLTEASDE